MQPQQTQTQTITQRVTAVLNLVTKITDAHALRDRVRNANVEQATVMIRVHMNKIFGLTDNEEIRESITAMVREISATISALAEPAEISTNTIIELHEIVVYFKYAEMNNARARRYRLRKRNQDMKMINESEVSNNASFNYTLPPHSITSNSGGTGTENSDYIMRDGKKYLICPDGSELEVYE